MVNRRGVSRKLRLEVELGRAEELVAAGGGGHAVDLVVVLDHAQVGALDDRLVGGGADGQRHRAAALQRNHARQPRVHLRHTGKTPGLSNATQREERRPQAGLTWSISMPRILRGIMSGSGLTNCSGASMNSLSASAVAKP